MPPARRKGVPTPITLSTPDAPPAAVQSPAASSVAQPAALPAAAVVDEPPAKPVFRQRSVYLEQELWERARGAIAYVKYFELDGEPDTLASLIGAALEQEVAKLENRYNDGRPFRRPKRLSTGPGRSGVTRLEQPRGER